MKQFRNQPFYFVNDIWVNMPAAFALPKHSPVRDEISRFIMRMVDAGIINKIFRDYTFIHEDIGKLNRIVQQESVSTLGLNHFAGLFTFCGIILVLGSVIFLWEVNWAPKKNN